MAVGHAPGSAVVGVTIAFTILAALSTVSRLITRLAIVRSAGIDDLVIAIALVCSIALTTCMVMQVKYGMGRHESTLSDTDRTYSLIWFWASVWIYYLALMFVKLSILFQYLRIFPEKRFRKWCCGLMAVIVGWTFWAFFSALLACWPIQHFWNAAIPGACLNRLAVWFSNAAVNIVTDIATAALPLPALSTLNLPKRQRYILMGVFGMGGVVCVISILRLSSLYTISISTDVSWDNPLAAIWSSCEVNVGILCSCVPTLKGCITRYFPNLFSTPSHASSRPTGDFGGLELSGRHRANLHASCHISATRSANRDETRMEKLSRVTHKFGGGRHEKYIEEEEVSSRDSSSLNERLTPTSERGHGIHVTTIVEQREEDDRTRSLGRAESESIRGLVPTRPYRHA